MVFPFAFEKLLNAALPSEEVAPLLDSLHWPSHTSVRLNPKKNITLNRSLVLSEIPFCSQAFLLKDRPEFVADPAFHSGAYYVQEASSTIIGTLVSQLLEPNETTATVLDLCAAPGGKSTHIASVLRPGDVLVANEVIQSRTPVLNENLSKWGCGNHMVTRADAAQLGKCINTFDLIVADMPCSGEGLFRKDPNSLNQWSEDNVNLCSARQNRIAQDIWPALKPGGFFIYSTCTFNTKENEENIQRIALELEAEIMAWEFPDSWNLFSQSHGCYRLLPHRSPGEGFFFAILRKNDSDSGTNKRGKFAKKSEFILAETEIPLPDNYLLYARNDEVYSIKNCEPGLLFPLLVQLPNIYAPGTLVGKTLQKRHKTQLKPEVSLALIADLQRHFYPELALDDVDVLRFLRRDPMANNSRQEGIHLFTWKNIPIGFANGLQHQWNHGWPMDWRVRKEGLKTATIVS